MASRRLEVVIAGDASGATRALGQVENRADRTGRSMTSLRRVGSTLAGAFAAIGATQFLRGAIAEAEEAESVMRQTRAVIQSTGGAAGVTAGHLADLAGELSGIAAVDDEVIQQGGNLLLTFRNVRAEGGIFDDALASALDMAAAMGTQLQPNIMAVGRALNDPIAGISRLTRMGVTFTDQQKDQIAAMQFFGDTAGAQRIILEELATEFGGAAEANATATGRMRVAWANIQESLGTMLLPVLDQVSAKFSEIAAWFQENPEQARNAILGVAAAFSLLWLASTGWIGAIVAGIGVVVAEWVYLYKNVDQVRLAIDTGRRGAVEFGKRVMEMIRSVDFEPMLKSLRDLGRQINTLGESFGGWGQVAKVVLGAIGLGLQYIIAVARSVLIGVTAVVQVFARLGSLSLAQIQGAVRFLGSLVSGLGGAVSGAISWVQKLAGQNLGPIMSAASSLYNLFQRVRDAINGAVSAVGSLASRLGSVSLGPLGALLEAAPAGGPALAGAGGVAMVTGVGGRGGRRALGGSSRASDMNVTVMLPDGQVLGRTTVKANRRDHRAYHGADGSDY